MVAVSFIGGGNWSTRRKTTDLSNESVRRWAQLVSIGDCLLKKTSTKYNKYVVHKNSSILMMLQNHALISGFLCNLPITTNVVSWNPA
jgi:hypothetical protein